MYDYKAQITNIVDGDTFDMDIDLGFHIHIHERVRILDLDTPEKRGNEKELGLIVTKFADTHFLGRNAIIFSEKEIVPKTDSFGRWLVRVVLQDGKYIGKSVTDVYNTLGVNKYRGNYSEQNVLKLRENL